VLAAAVAALCAGPVAAQKVQVADGDWRGLPLMKVSKYQAMAPDVAEQLHKLVSSGQCELQGVSRKRVNMVVPYLVRFSADGSIQEVVLKKLGCPKAEGILARVVLKWAQNGTIGSTGVNTEGWYRSEINFSSDI
jgi:hypothetical protein